MVWSSKIMINAYMLLINILPFLAQGLLQTVLVRQKLFGAHVFSDRLVVFKNALAVHKAL